MNLRDFDKELSQAIDLELERQRSHIELIASENFVSKAVLEAQGSILTNKYAEGYSGKRYYGGCKPAATKPAMCAISTIKKHFLSALAVTLSAISLNLLKSIILE